MKKLEQTVLPPSPSRHNLALPLFGGNSLQTLPTPCAYADSNEFRPLGAMTNLQIAVDRIEFAQKMCNHFRIFVVMGNFELTLGAEQIRNICILAHVDHGR